MSYPELPNNRLIVNGVDLTTRFRMVLLDGYTLSPPEPRTYMVEVPGRDGLIDLTESLTGDIPYSNRQMSFTFVIVDLDEFEAIKTQVSNFLHGKAFDFQMTMDPEYTYHGRFTVSSYAHVASWNHGICGFFDIAIDADPYKTKSHMVYNLNAVGGAAFELPSGRKKNHPIIETTAPTRIKHKNVIYRLGAGRYQLNDILFEEGLNEIYINSYELSNFTWDEWKTVGPIVIRAIGVTVNDGEILFLHSTLDNWDRTVESSKRIFTQVGDAYELVLHVAKGTSFHFQLCKQLVSEPLENLETTVTPSYDKDLPNDANAYITANLRTVYEKAWGSTDISKVGYVNDQQYATWNEYEGQVRWDDLQKTEGLIQDVRQKWGDFYNGSWSALHQDRWKDLNFRIEGAPDAYVTLEYDWKDL